MLIFEIDGAVVYPEIKMITFQGEPAIKFPEPNSDYKYCFVDTCGFENGSGIILASKDGKVFVYAVGVLIHGRKYGPRELLKLSFE